jgi:hypothetical protein
MIVSYEDRESHCVGLKLLVLSLERHCPDSPVDITVARAGAQLTDWFKKRRARLRTGKIGGAGYNVKPTLLRRALEEGATEAIWLDSDIIVTGDPGQLWRGCPPNTIAVAEEFLGAPNQGGDLRTQAWNLPVGRELPSTTNSCVVRVTPAHLHLLRAWEDLLDSDEYKNAQSRKWDQRPPHLMGDQDALSALLGSELFGEIPIRWIRRGSEVAHCFEGRGYILHQRLSNMIAGRTPLLLHGQGPKPWHPVSPSPGRLHLEVSPYTLAAFTYLDLLGEDTKWAERASIRAKLLRSIFRRHLTATGILPAVAAELRDMRIAKTLVHRLLKRVRRFRSEARGQAPEKGNAF